MTLACGILVPQFISHRMPSSPSLSLQFEEAVGDPLGRADDDLFAQRILIADGLQPPAARRAILDRAHAGAGRRILEPLAEVAVEIHDAFFRLVARRLVGLGDVNRRAQVHLAVARVPRFLPRLPIGGDVGLQLLERAEPNRDEHGMAELGDRREGIGAVGGDADLRPRLLIGLRGQLDVVEAVILAFVRKAVFGPRPLQDFERLGKALAALAIGHAIGFVGPRETAAPDPENQPAMADLVDRRDLFGEAQRMAQRQYLDPGADLDPLGARRDRARQGQRGGAHRAFRRDVDLGQPHRIEPPALGRVDLLEGDPESVLLGHPGGPLKLVKHAELERHRLPPSCPRATPAGPGAHLAIAGA